MVRGPGVALFPAAQQAERATTHGIAVQNLDSTVKPGDNFYLYANGGWMKRAVIPADRSGLGVFDALRDKSNQRVLAIVEDAGKAHAAAGTNTQKIADLYRSYMDTRTLESRGMAPIAPLLKAVDAIHTKRELARALGASLREDVDALNNTNFHTPNLFGLWVAPGFSDPAHYAGYLLQGGLELPDRDYYLSESESMRALRTKYKAHIVAMLKLAGYDEPGARAQRIFALEHAIAEKHLSLAENEDMAKANNPWKRSDFLSKAPGLDWDEYFSGAGLEAQPSFVVWQPAAFAGEAALVDSVALEAWKDWLAYHLLEDYAEMLPAKFDDENFALTGKILKGTLQQRPRWERGVTLVNQQLGEAVGPVYAQRYFSPQAKAEAEALVAHIIAAYRERLQALSWMAPATKAEAIAKLDGLYVGIGHAETWQKFSGYEVKADDLFGNCWRGSLFYYRTHSARVGKPVQRREWSMTPQTVNAVNLPLQNALNFPAAILEPPFFDSAAPAAANYGAIGSIIGHEISHTFDSEGSAFDSHGGMRDWWTAEDFAHFRASTAKLAAQYDRYRPFADLAVNGRQTLAEDIADVAGVSAAFDGYRASLHGEAGAVVHGFTSDQQFFIAYGQNWASKQRPAALRQRVLTDPHAPGEYRADTVRNLDVWYTALGVRPGEMLYLEPVDRVKIW